MQHDEKRISRAEQRALMLFGQIVAELDPENFSLEEIWDEFGRHTNKIDDPLERTPRTEGDVGFWKVTPKAELDVLARLGYIEETDRGDDSYRVTELGRILAEQE